MNTAALIVGLLAGAAAALVVGTVIAEEASPHDEWAWWGWDWSWHDWGWSWSPGCCGPHFGHASFIGPRAVGSFDLPTLSESVATHVVVEGSRLQDAHVFLVGSPCSVTMGERNGEPSNALDQASVTFGDDENENETSHTFDATLHARLLPGQSFSIRWVAHAHAIFPATACRDLMAGPVVEAAGAPRGAHVGPVVPVSPVASEVVTGPAGTTGAT